MKKITIYLFLLLTLTACVSPEVARMQKWEAWAVEEVKAGRMKSSEFFQGQYNNFASLPPSEITNLFLPVMSHGIYLSQQYESGKIPAEQLQKYHNDVAFLAHQVNYQVTQR